MKKIFLNSGFSLLFSLVTLLTFSQLILPEESKAIQPDDEKEFGSNCAATPGYVQIVCIEGSIDCNPLNCP